jgi:SSS family transporter
MDVFALGALISLLGVGVVGFYAYRLVRGKVDAYYVMERRAGPWLIAGTFIASWISMGTFVGMLGLGYKWGGLVTMWWYGSLWGITFFMVYIGLPLRRGEFLTLPDFYSDTFDSTKLRLMAAIVLILGQTGYACLQIIGAGKTFQHILGLPYEWGVLLFVVVTGAYVISGGQWAVVITDFLSLLIFIIAAFIAFPFAISKVGGWGAIVHDLPAKMPGVLNWDGIPHLPLAYVLGAGFLTFFALTFSSPYLVTRAYVAKDERSLLRGLAGGQAVAVPFMWLLMLMPAILHLAGANLKDADFAAPFWAKNMMPMFAGVLIFCGITQAGLSTLDSLAITAGTAIGRDIYQRCINPNAAERLVVNVTRLGIAAVLLVGLIVALTRTGLVMFVGIWAAGVFAATFLPAIIIGLYYKRATSHGLFWGMLIGLAVYLPLSYSEKMMGGVKFAKSFGLGAVIWASIACAIAILVISVLTSRGAEEEAAYEKTTKKMFPLGRYTVRSLQEATSFDRWWPWATAIGVSIFAFYYSYVLIAS